LDSHRPPPCRRWPVRGKEGPEAKRIYDSMKFGAEPTREGREPGLEVPTFAPRSRSWDWERIDGGVDHQPSRFRMAGDSFKQSIEHDHLDPAIIASFRSLIRGKELRKITPTAAPSAIPTTAR